MAKVISKTRHGDRTPHPAIHDGPERRINHARRRRVCEMTTEELRAELLTDPLTGVGSRRAFEEREAQKGEIIVLCDVDSLKYVNDTYGHAAGDALLQLVGSVFAMVVAVGTTVFRVSGDEFAVVLAPEVDGYVSVSLREALSRQIEYLPLHWHRWQDAADVTWVMKGATVTAGWGSTLAKADEDLMVQKERSLRAGRRAPRGERPPELQVWRGEAR